MKSKIKKPRVKRPLQPSIAYAAFRPGRSEKGVDRPSTEPGVNDDMPSRRPGGGGCSIIRRARR